MSMMAAVVCSSSSSLSPSRTTGIAANSSIRRHPLRSCACRRVTVGTSSSPSVRVSAAANNKHQRRQLLLRNGASSAVRAAPPHRGRRVVVLAAAAPAAAGDDNTRTAPSSQQLAFAAAPITRDPIRNEALYYVKLNPEMRLEDATQLIAKTASEWAAKAAHVEQQPFSSVLELMTPVDDLVTLRADEPLSAAVTRFLETGVNLLPVLGPEGTADSEMLTGVLAQSDVMGLCSHAGNDESLCRRHSQTGGPLHYTDSKVADAMTTAPLLTIGPSRLYYEAVRLLLTYQLHTLPVVREEDGRLMGVISRLDIIRQIQEDHEDSGAPPRPWKPTARPGANAAASTRKEATSGGNKEHKKKNQEAGGEEDDDHGSNGNGNGAASPPTE